MESAAAEIQTSLSCLWGRLTPGQQDTLNLFSKSLASKIRAIKNHKCFPCLGIVFTVTLLQKTYQKKRQKNNRNGNIMCAWDLLRSQIQFPWITATSPMPPLMNGSCSVSKTAKRAIRRTIAVQPRIDVKDILYVKPVSLTREVQRWRKEAHCTFYTEGWHINLRVHYLESHLSS